MPDMTRLLIVAIFLALAVLAKAAVAGECTTYDILSKRLAEREGQVLAFGGLITDTSMLQIWRDDRSGRWTVLEVLVDGTTCIVRVGEYWQDWHAEPPGVPG
ncbi:hypothetical protein [Roseovarius indicus]|uniref:hypothetical protein n=1 Tax=Roseovarius indicus TaxID=540747 RepID=UPI0010FF31E7|nr:hypothetical protein [Roseovarius indicus]